MATVMISVFNTTQFNTTFLHVKSFFSTSFSYSYVGSHELKVINAFAPVELENKHSIVSCINTLFGGSCHLRHPESNKKPTIQQRKGMGFLFIALILYIIWDVNYFIRCIFTVLTGRLFQSKRKVTDTTTIYGLCTSQDVDIFIRHMNNARYLRELDFARFHFYALTGLYEKVKERHGGAVQGASSVRYRRTIPIFRPYKIQTKLIWWDDKAIYLEQQFVTLTDGFVRAVALSKQCITNCDVMEIMRTYQEASKRPELPEELKLWLEAIELSSQKLRKDK